ncbi:hypothetical protein QTP70_019203 [Hemibagrus guttatus]|uniref:Integrase catalytic domain-containing protein n=1 Tax=Hemibagrus guttatus TaxID=175788 RepID=A0AAE0RHD1_9TELE|nr:hypothetical protein QTP70_019203 [Hemibagrus guttatus]
MFCYMFRNFGLPEDIVSDRGPQFTSRVWGALCAQLDIGVSLSSSHHPQSNGQAERLNQEIGHFLRSYCSREQHRWTPAVPMVGEPSSVPAVEEWFRVSQRVWERAHVRLQRAVKRQRIQADRHRHPHPAYQVGQRVWLSTRNLRLKLPCRKLSPEFIGPFEIIHQVNPVAYRLQLPASYRICPTFHASLLKPAHSSAGEAVVGGSGRDSSTSRTGRGTAPRSGHGWTPPTSWIHHSLRTSTATTRPDPLRGSGGGPGAEPPKVFLEGGALS